MSETGSGAANAASASSVGHDPHRPVGYANPPVKSQFKKGQSGNPRGRPGGRKNLTTILNETLYGKITVRERGHTRKITMIEALLLRLRKDALEGDLRAVDRLLRLIQMQQALSPDEDKTEAIAFDPVDDQAILKELAGWSVSTDIQSGDLTLEDEDS